MRRLAVLAFCILAACGGGRDDAPERAVAGSVCGDSSLRGEVLGDVDGAGACGVRNAVLLREVSGVTLSSPATITCGTARALKSWVEDGARPAVGRTGGGIASLRVAADFSCRSRNNQPGAQLSEHSFGHAIDISAIVMRDGSAMTVLDDWDGSRYGAQLRRMWRAACGPFGTVLGPDADRFHQDHFHFDIADNGPRGYCR